ncbi:transposase [Dehalococcoidia bacterium]|nr:transposase [Dehalococcoidia bacterium]MCL0075801.1 transposase [Dehalococcoidia bacterium]
MRIKLLSTALEDLSDGRLFYEKQGEGLGEYFFDSLFSDIDSLMLYGGIHPKVFGYHRMLSKRFPYAIYYREDFDFEIEAVEITKDHIHLFLSFPPKVFHIKGGRYTKKHLSQ